MMTQKRDLYLKLVTTLSGMTVFLNFVVFKYSLQ